MPGTGASPSAGGTRADADVGQVPDSGQTELVVFRVSHLQPHAMKRPHRAVDNVKDTDMLLCRYPVHRVCRTPSGMEVCVSRNIQAHVDCASLFTGQVPAMGLVSELRQWTVSSAVEPNVTIPSTSYHLGRVVSITPPLAEALLQLCEAGAFPGSDHRLHSTGEDDQDSAMSQLTEMGLATLHGLHGATSWQLTPQGLSHCEAEIWLKDPKLVCQPRAEVSESPSSMTTLELYLKLQEEGWQEEAATTKRSAKWPPYQHRGAKRFYSINGSLDHSYAACLFCADRLFEQGLSALHHGQLTSYYKCLLHLSQMGSGDLCKVLPHRTAKWYQDIIALGATPTRPTRRRSSLQDDDGGLATPSVIAAKASGTAPPPQPLRGRGGRGRPLQLRAPRAVRATLAQTYTELQAVGT